MKKKYRKSFFLVLSMFLLIITGCAKQKEANIAETKFLVYYLNKEENQIVAQEYLTEETGMEKVATELLTQLCTQPENVEYKATIPNTLTINKCYIEQTQIVIDFNTAYSEIVPTKEILMRAAIVKTLNQIPGIEYIMIQVNKDPLKDAMGNLIGVMSADMFVNNTEQGINDYEKVKLKLYLANEKGDKLLPITRTVVYNKNTSAISMEKLVTEELIKGPANEESYPVVNSDTKIISVSTKDGVCYLNLSEEFLENKTKATPEVTIYAISNTLVELSNVNKVQILINGESKYTYREVIPLSAMYERNLDIVQQ